MLGSVLALILVAAPSPNVVDKQVFERTYRASKAIEGALAVGVNGLRFQELVQALSTEVFIARDGVKTPNEGLLLGYYVNALKLLASAGEAWADDVERQRWIDAGLKRLAIASRLYSSDPATVAVAAARAKREMAEVEVAEQAERQARAAAIGTLERQAAERASARKRSDREAQAQEAAARAKAEADEAVAREAEIAAEGWIREKRETELQTRLRADLGSSSAEQREMAARTLAVQGSRAAWSLPLLRELAKDPVPAVSSAAARAAAEISAALRVAVEADRAEFEPRLRDPDSRTRELAARTLAERRGVAAAWAIPLLIEIYTNDTHADARAAARSALALIGTPEAVAALQ